jgi:hypothetical protein
LNKDFKLLLILFAGLIIIASCESKEPECYQPTVVRALCKFKYRDTQIVEVQVGNDTNNVINDTIDIFPDSLMNSPQMRIIGESKDVLIQGVRNDRSLRILFNYSKDSIRYTFRTDSTSSVFDTITFYYEPSVHFISNNCGYNYFYNIKKVAHTTHMLDSFSITNSNVTDDAKSENVQLYFKRNF